MDFTTLITGLILGLIIGLLIMRVFAFFEHKSIRRESIKGSKNQILGGLYEKILPALPNFPYAPKDMVFVGKGCDYIIFDGLSEGRLREVIFLELKSGGATLNANERSIKDVIDRKRVYFSEYRINSTKNKE